MADGKHCPHCGEDIGVWPVFSAGLPSRIWCPHCGARVRYLDARGPLLVALAAGLAVIVAGLGVALLVALRGGNHPLVLAGAFAGLPFGGMVVVELLAVCYLRARRRLVVTEVPPARPGGPTN